MDLRHRPAVFPAATLETDKTENDNVTGSAIRLQRHPMAGKVEVEWKGARAYFTDVRRKLACSLNGPARRRAAAGCRHDVPRGSESHPERRTAPSGTVRTVVAATGHDKPVQACPRRPRRAAL